MHNTALQNERGGGVIWVFVVAGRETHMVFLLGLGLREIKPINFGSHKDEGNEINTVLGY